MKKLLLVFLIACGGSKPASAPEPTTPSTPPPRAAKCAGEGTPCDTPDATCGSEMCRDTTTFCNVMICKDGTWQPLEVAPLAPTSP